MTDRRLPALIVIVAVLAALVALSRDGRSDSAPPFGQVDAAAMPRGVGSGALSSTWYCAAGTAQKDSSTNLTVVVANAGDSIRTGAVTWIPTGSGKPVSVPVRVGPNAAVSVAAVDHVTAPIVSALVEMDGGGVAVEHVVSGADSSGVAPCASRASTRWYLANGITERDSHQVLALFNPFPDDAVVDLSFATDSGRDSPGKLQGLPIAAGTTTFVKVEDFVRRRGVTATSVVARTGRLVVDRVQSFDGTTGRNGVSLAVAASATAETWRFAEGIYGLGVSEAWHVYNPTGREAEVSLQIVPVSGEVPEPLDLTIPPHSQQVIEAATASRVPELVAHSSSVQSLNGVPIVVERSVDARSPSVHRGWSSAFGATEVARRWVFPVGEANAHTDEWIVVHNPGEHKVKVSVVGLVGGQRLAIEGLQDLSVGPAGRLAVRLGDHISRSPLPVLVEATAGVVVERDAYAVGRAGLSTIMGIPVP